MDCLIFFPKKPLWSYLWFPMIKTNFYPFFRFYTSIMYDFARFGSGSCYNHCNEICADVRHLDNLGRARWCSCQYIFHEVKCLLIKCLVIKFILVKCLLVKCLVVSWSNISRSNIYVMVKFLGSNKNEHRGEYSVLVPAPWHRLSFFKIWPFPAEFHITNVCSI